MKLKKNREPVWKGWGPLLLLIVLSLHFSACGALKEIKEAATGLKTTLKKGDKLLDKADTSTIEPFTRNAARGFIAGVNLDSLKVQGFVNNLLLELDHTLTRELDELKLNGLDAELSRNLRGVLDNDTLRQSFKTLLADLIMDLEKRKIKLNVEVNLNDEALLTLVDKLKTGLLNDSTAKDLTNVLNQALLGLSQGGGLDSLLSKVSASVADVDRKLAEQNKSWQKFVDKLWIALASLLVLGVLGVGYFFRKRAQYKKLATVLTKGIDQIADRQDYDRILEVINNQVEAQQIRKQLIGILEEHQGEYPKKARYGTYADRSLELIQEALNGDNEIRNKILAHAKTEPELLNFIQERLHRNQVVN